MLKKMARTYAVATHPELQGLPVIMFVFGAIFAAAAWYFKSTVPAVVTLLLWGGCGYLVSLAKRSFDKRGADPLKARTRQWTNDPEDDDDEARQRFAYAESASSLTTMAAAGAMSANADGTPMVGDTGVDIYGRVFGDLSGDHNNWDPLGADVGTGLSMDASDAYSSPHGMD